MRQAGMRTGRPIGMIRVASAGLLIVHGAYRALHAGNVAGFGAFLAESGIPMGIPIAWGITAFEVIGGALLLSGMAVRPLALMFAFELAAGIALVHVREGWFVVGGGRNGMEYSVLLITCMLAVAWDRAHQSRVD